MPSARMAICLFISKLGAYCGAVFEIMNPLLPIGRNTPSSSLLISPIRRLLLEGRSGLAAPDPHDLVDAEPVVRAHEVHGGLVLGRLDPVHRLGGQQREEAARARVDIGRDDAAIARDAADDEGP